MSDSLEQYKKIRDPIYGYIKIEESIAHNIIDTAAFQRLRNIRQTSYAPLYPSSLHNRFVHSLGVYYLGCMAFKSICRSLDYHQEAGTETLKEIKALMSTSIKRYKKLFQLACLLHDVGHSPFSHTGEVFYANSLSCVKLKKGQKYSIYSHLSYLTNDKDFEAAKTFDVAPHEVMSCIVALEKFGKDDTYFQSNAERSFFARCITGIPYGKTLPITQEHIMSMKDSKLKDARKKMFLNCIIRLLHSTVIDVDRLDYIIRDAATMGYQSVSIDYKRLLSGLELVMEDDYNFTVGFHKNAISIIENAVFAHDNEKKWVQSHPAIIYETFLLKQAIIYVESRIRHEYPGSSSTLFGFDSLTDTGSKFLSKSENEQKVDTLHIHYLCDADLIFLIKNRYISHYSEEYFNRNKRRLPVWKSEAEFRSLFTESERKTINEAMEKIMSNNTGLVDDIEITEETLEDIKKAIEEAKIGFTERAIILEKKHAYITKIFDLCEQFGISKSFVLISKTFFKSNFSKDDMGKIPIYFPANQKFCALKKVSTTLSSNRTENEKLIYFYYYPKQNREKIDTDSFSKKLLGILK